SRPPDVAGHAASEMPSPVVYFHERLFCIQSSSWWLPSCLYNNRSPRLRWVRQLVNRRMHMKKLSVIGATLLGATVLFAAPISLHLSQDKGMSLSADEAQARIGRPLSPGSIAGVHRRYERRAYRRGSYGQGYSGSGGSYGV